MLKTAGIVLASAAFLRYLQNLSISAAGRKANKGRTVSSPDETGAHAFVLTNSKRVEVYCRRWGTLQNPSASVILIHSEILDGSFFKPIAEQLVEKGFVCYALDLTGFGKSGVQNGTDSHIESYKDYLEDIGLLVKVAKRDTEGKPVILFGEDLGATCALAYALDGEGKENVSKVLACAPMLSPPVPPEAVESGLTGFLGKISSTFCGPREKPEYDLVSLFDDEEIGVAAKNNFEK